MTEEERREKFGWMNKLTDEEKNIAVIKIVKATNQKILDNMKNNIMPPLFKTRDGEIRFEKNMCKIFNIEYDGQE
jgi:hypothetical protein